MGSIIKSQLSLQKKSIQAVVKNRLNNSFFDPFTYHNLLLSFINKLTAKRISIDDAFISSLFTIPPFKCYDLNLNYEEIVALNGRSIIEDLDNIPTRYSYPSNRLDSCYCDSAMVALFAPTRHFNIFFKYGSNPENTSTEISSPFGFDLRGAIRYIDAISKAPYSIGQNESSVFIEQTVNRERAKIISGYLFTFAKEFYTGFSPSTVTGTIDKLRKYLVDERLAYGLERDDPFFFLDTVISQSGASNLFFPVVLKKTKFVRKHTSYDNDIYEAYKSELKSDFFSLGDVMNSWLRQGDRKHVSLSTLFDIEQNEHFRMMLKTSNINPESGIHRKTEEELLEHYVTEEHIKNEILYLPEVFAVKIERTVEAYSGVGMNTLIEFEWDEKIKLVHYNGMEEYYEVMSVVNFKGGHYTCYFKDFATRKKGSVFRYDDTNSIPAVEIDPKNLKSGTKDKNKDCTLIFLKKRSN